MRTQTNKWSRLALFAGVATIITACSDGGSVLNGGSTQSFSVNVVNLTAAQPFSPIALVAHDSSYSIFNVGDSASSGLELLAEGGDNSEFIAEAESNASVLMTLSGDTPLGPGANEDFSFTVSEGDLGGLSLSAVSMLVNTNDAITAAMGVDLDGIEVGESLSLTTISYDAGTEANTEELGSIPGPAVNGVGFVALRDDSDQILAHAGVITADDGLATSALSEVHRWDNPVARVTITRTE